MRPTLPLLAVALVAAGCRPATPPPPTAPPQQVGVRAEVPGPPLVSLTPAAVASLQTFAAEFDAGRAWWVRITVTPGGCTGFQTKLDLDTVGVLPGDRETTCDGVRVLYRADHEPLIQGAVIDFVSTDKERGFKVDYPNQTDENRKRTQEWVKAELDARQFRHANHGK